MDSTERRLDHFEVLITDLFRQVRDLRESRTDGLATLNKGIDDLRQRIESRFAKADEERALDVTATDARTDRLSGIIDEYERRLRVIENILIGQGWDLRTEPKSAKPTIKGGWVNVYRHPHGGALTFSQLYPTSGMALDTRIEHGGSLIFVACIRIPDFTEGEGL